MKNKILVLLIATIPTCGLLAQNKPIGKEVDVTRTYDPAVMDAQKIWYSPTIDPDSLKTKGSFNYSLSPKTMFGDFGLTPISSASIKERDRNDNGPGYIRVGAGAPLSGLVDAYISNNNAKTILLGMYANHRSYWGKATLTDSDATKKVDADNMSNAIGGFAKKTFSSATLSANLDYDGRRLLLYGYPAIWYTKNTFNNSDNRQVFNFFNASMQLESTTTGDDRFDYSVGGSFQNFTDHYNMKENAVSASGMLAKHFNGQHIFSLNLRFANYSRNEQLDNSWTNLLFGITPTYTYKYEGFTGKLGAQFVLDSYDGKSKNRFYPALSASYRIASFLIPTVELKGETEVNSYRKLAYGCNFINPGLDGYKGVGSIQRFKNTYHKLAFVASIKGEAGSAVSYNIFTSYSSIANLAMYVNQPDIFTPNGFTNKLDVAYDRGSRLSIGGELQVTTDDFKFYTKIAHNKYSLDSFKEAIHLPTLEGNFQASYTLDNSWVFTASFTMATGRYYQYMFNGLLWDDPVKMKNIFDVGVDVEYFFTKQFSVFGNVNNLLNQQYDLFHQYTVPGIIVGGGVTYRF